MWGNAGPFEAVGNPVVRKAVGNLAAHIEMGIEPDCTVEMDIVGRGLTVVDTVAED